MNDKPVLVIGDVHGHVDRLEALLHQEGTKDKDCYVIQLGDLGHFGVHTKSGDLMAWKMAYDGLIDFVLWGNHDRAVVDHHHEFSGFDEPDPEPMHIMKTMEAQGRLLMAQEAHGWLLTHAGLHKAFRSAWRVPPEVNKHDAGSIAAWLNREQFVAGKKEAIDNIGPRRGGWNATGGVLWRDITEKLYEEVPQIFGHSANKDHIVRGEQDKWYCIDIGGKGGRHDADAECLAGLWLPEQKIVRVDPLKGRRP